MEYEGVPDVRLETDLWNQRDELRQNPLMAEGTFLSFLRNRGIPVFGVVEGEPGEFVRRLWLEYDGVDQHGSPLFHPFRMFPMHRILERCSLRIASRASLNPEGYLRLAESSLKRMPKDDDFQALGREWNRVVDLATLLEPIYWPQIVGRRRFSGDLSIEHMTKALVEFRASTLAFLKTLDLALWKRVHECLLLDASGMDRNSHLYVLLRVAHWKEREALTGTLSGAMWLRHMAEVIRRGFEDGFDQQWPEEYEIGGHFYQGAKERTFGSERPLENAMRTKPFVAYEFGLFTGSSVRWYVEGVTEYFALQELLSDPVYYGVELINLHGEIAARKGNLAIRLENMLREDRRLRRFSMISLDADVRANVAFIRRQILDGNLVGGVALHKPDFEFANFSFAELVEIAATMDEKIGSSGALIRQANCSEITGAKQFEEWYCTASARSGDSLKGETWGRALGRYARDHPELDAANERSIIGQMRAAIFGWSTSYVSHYRRFTLDPDTFRLIPKPMEQKK